MDCIFCDIIERKSEAEIIYEDENIISFLDIRPVNYGHTLVIPKKHFDDFLSVSPEDMNRLITGLQVVSAAVKKSVNADGLNIVVNSGKAAGQTVFHFHFHIIPRFANDFMFKPNFKKYSNGSMKEFAEKIKIELNKDKDPFYG